ncbi:MAG: hypothetical protein ACR652_03325 [Methylocystis sp.]|uniref:hypothetical protein n=1 Tax=Methylocystis sp. TaxID=1911079 RepID=UPI003DA5108C
MNSAAILTGRPDKRRRRTRAQIEQLDAQIIDVLREDHPQSVRHVFYRMTDPRLPEPVEKSDQGYAQVQSRLVKLRRAGAIPYSWLSDMSRRGYFVNTFSGAGDFIAQMRGLYRADLWEDAGVKVEVWCESRSIASVIQDDCRELAVSLYPCGGFSSISFAHEAAQELNRTVTTYTDDTRDPVVVLYIGDYDPAGVLIDVALERELRQHLEPAIPLHFTRIGITRLQIAAYGLPEKPRKTGERRALHVECTVEAEAMPAHILREILREEIESYLPENALRVAKVAEESEKAHLDRIAAMLGGGAQ